MGKVPVLLFVCATSRSPSWLRTLTTAYNLRMCLLALLMICCLQGELSKGVETMKFEVQENYLTIYLPKDLDHHSAEEIKREADRLIERGHIRYVIFDFAGTEFCDSSGIGVIMGRYKKVCMFGGEVWAAHTSERIKKILKMSGAAKIMQIYEEEK